MKECASICHSHFFDANAMHGFQSRVADRAYIDGKGGAYFVTSERSRHGTRGYSVRHYDPNRCDISTVGEFQGYKRSEQAHRAAQRLATAGGSLGRHRSRRPL